MSHDCQMGVMTAPNHCLSLSPPYWGDIDSMVTSKPNTQFHLHYTIMGKDSEHGQDTSKI